MRTLAEACSLCLIRCPSFGLYTLRAESWKNGTFNWKKNSYASLDSLAACKFSSHSSEHRRRSYAFSPRSRIGMHAIYVPRIITNMHGYALSRSTMPPSQLLSISEAYCARLSPKIRAGTLRKWLYSLGCPQALGGKFRPNTHNCFARLGGVIPSPRDCGPVTIYSQGRSQGGFPVARKPLRPVEFFSCVDYDGRGSPNWLGPLAYIKYNMPLDLGAIINIFAD